MLNWMQ